MHPMRKLANTAENGVFGHFKHFCNNSTSTEKEGIEAGEKRQQFQSRVPERGSSDIVWPVVQASQFGIRQRQPGRGNGGVAGPAAGPFRMKPVAALVFFLLCCGPTNQKSLSHPAHYQDPMEEELTGVDCNTPQHQAKYEIDDDVCQKSKEIINNGPIKKQILVHSRSWVDVNATNCFARKSVSRFQCWDGTLLDEERFLSVPVIEAIHEFSVEECQRMLLEQKYKSESNQDYPIKLDEENVIAYTSIGRMYQDERGKSFCNGVDVFDHKSNKVLKGVVETTSIRIIVRRNVPVRFEQKTGKTGIDLMTETEVPCSLQDRGCHGTTTYLWSDVTNKCNLVRGPT